MNNTIKKLPNKDIEVQELEKMSRCINYEKDIPKEDRTEFEEGKTYLTVNDKPMLVVAHVGNKMICARDGVSYIYNRDGVHNSQWDHNLTPVKV